MKKEKEITNAAIFYGRLTGETVNGSIISSPVISHSKNRVETKNTIYIVLSWHKDFNYENHEIGV